MSRTADTFYEVAEDEGWSDATMLDIVLEYVGNQGSDDAFADHLLSKCEKKFTAVVNTPGYLPESEPAHFADAREAWDYLLDERRNSEDDAVLDGSEDEPYSATFNTLERAAEGNYTDVGLDEVGLGTITGPTPGYTGDHDLGLAYSVSVRIAI